MRRLLLPICAASLLIAGCNTLAERKAEPSYSEAGSYSFIPANNNAAYVLLEQLEGRLDREVPVIVATVVNINSLEESSTFGRTVSEQVSARMTQGGYKMIEMKFRSSVYMKQNEGEFVLTREVKDMAASHNSQAVILGTYSEGGEYVFVNLKVVNPNDSSVLAAYSYTIPVDQNVRTMLRKPRVR